MLVAFIALHNRLVDRLRDDGVAERDVFEEARRAATWHYQHVILREFLPGLIGAELTAELLEDGPRLYRVDADPYIPFEFADAAYRYGHTQIRDRYRVNAHFGPCPVFPDLMGFGPVSLRAHRRLDPADRRRGARAGAARQAHRRPAPRAADRAAHADLGRRARDRLRVAGQSRPATRTRGRAGRRARPSRAASACRR